MRRVTFLLLLVVVANYAWAQFGNQNLISGQTNNPTAIFVSDLDGDSDLDIISSSYNDDKIAWYENLGGGVFGYQNIISNNADFASSVFSTDLDGDGDMDVLSSSTLDDKIAWYENLGGGVFGTQQIITTNADAATSVFSVDIDGDGDMDVLSTSSIDDKVAWYENQGGGTFGTQQVITLNANGAKAVYSTDMDGDSDMDVLSASAQDDKIAWYENQGGGVFSTQQVISTLADNAQSIYSEDLDGDGDKDVLSASQNDGKIAWYENLGGGTFGIQQVITNMAFSAQSVHASDMDGDGDMDVLTAASGNDTLAWYENLGGGIFGTQQVIYIDSISSAWFVYASDLDGDGDMDVIYTLEAHDEIIWCENTGGGVFGLPQKITSGTLSPRDVYSADLDGDGDVDVLSSSRLDNKIAWYENVGDGKFGSQQEVSRQVNGELSIHAADMDNDGDIDVLSVSDVDDKLAWYENMGGGAFGPQQVISLLAVRPKSVYASDLDGDGDMDVLSASYDDDKIAWYENLGGGTFGSQQIISTLADRAVCVYSSDLDGDGDMDVLSTSILDNEVAWYENLGGALFGSQQIIISTSNGPSSVYTADVDGDGDMDVLVSYNVDNKITWHENLGGGVFGGEQIIGTSIYGNSVYASDMDGDGDMDVFAASLTINEVAWFENLGGGVFGPKQSKNTGEGTPCKVITSDIDGDGDVDILSANTDDKIAWHANYIHHPERVKGLLYLDVNQNGNKDSLEGGISFISIHCTPLYDYGFTDSLGYYYLYFNDTVGNYEISPQLIQHWKITSDSLSYHVSIDSTFSFMSNLDFGLYPDTIIDDLNIELIGGFPRCNNIVNYWLDVKNIGTTTPSGVIHLQLNDSISYVSSAIPPDSINGQNLYWHYDSLFYFSHEQINLQVLMPDFNSMGDTLTSFLNVSVIDSLGNQTYLASDTLNPILVCAYDPNDKIADPVGIDSLGYISPNTNHIEYTIRFQNTGNDTALTVVIKDQLDTNLQWQALVPLASSHPMDIDINQNGEVSFTFNNIMLPDSGTDFLGSQGFVKYKIDLKQGLAPGTSIFNTANIYFDQNPAVITNTKINTIYNCNGFVQNTISNFNVCQNDTIIGSVTDDLSTTEFSWDIPNVYNSTGQNFEWVTDTTGTFSLTLSTANSICEKDTTISITVNSLPNVTLANFNPDTLCDNGTPVVLPTGTPSGGSYTGNGVGGGNFDPATAGLGTHQVIYTYTDANSCINSDTTIVTVEVCTGIDNVPNDFGILIYPNPNTGLFTIEKPNGLQEVVQVKLLDATSKLIIDKVIPVGKQKLEMDITNYSDGIYYLQLIVGEEVFVKQILKD